MNRLALISLLIGVICACTPQQKNNSIYLDTFFPNDSTLFRGIHLGDSIQIIEEKEGLTPQHKDEHGLSYNYPLSEKGAYTIEYFTRPGARSLLIAIVVSIEVQDEASTASLYSELENYLEAKWGLPDGPYGKRNWESELQNTGIDLIISANKRRITMNLYHLN